MTPAVGAPTGSVGAARGGGAAAAATAEAADETVRAGGCGSNVRGEPPLKPPRRDRSESFVATEEDEKEAVEEEEPPPTKGDSTKGVMHAPHEEDDASLLNSHTSHVQGPLGMEEEEKEDVHHRSRGRSGWRGVYGRLG